MNDDIGYIRLWQAVIVQGLFDLQRKVNAYTTDHEIREAKTFFFSRVADLKAHCLIAGFCPERMNKYAQRIVNREVIIAPDAVNAIKVKVRRR